MNQLSYEDIIAEMKRLTGTKSDADLAAALGTNKQNISQFKKGKQHDIKYKMLMFLLDELEKKSKPTK
ncbi:hypothetical protein L1D14_07365 [Vibrio tubiashii]|uniref:hypothetical protein n=1 Tax=Vibrio tubiashii TaxID=29498 RepID=UPI001EFDDC4A|nr:hypothetical protein [Vibrio tubiashii]MCG9576056.1 hypothetical protein [Vibrio tubiashii]